MLLPISFSKSQFDSKAMEYDNGNGIFIFVLNTSDLFYFWVNF